MPDKNGRKYTKTVSETMPNVEIGVVDGSGKIAINSKERVKIPTSGFFRQGQVVTLIPGLKGLKTPILLPVKRKTLEEEDVRSVSRAVEVFMNTENSPLYESIKKTYNLDLHKAKDLRTYLSNFIFISNVKIDNEDDFDTRANTFDTHVPLINFEGNTLYFSFGLGVGKGLLKKGTKVGRAELERLEIFLTKNYINVDINELGGKKKVFHISKDDTIVNFEGNYNEFVKTKMLSNHMSITLPSGKEIYTIQGSIQLDVEGALSNAARIGATGTGLGNKTNYILDNFNTGEEVQNEETGEVPPINSDVLPVVNNINLSIYDEEGEEEDESPLEDDNVSDLAPLEEGIKNKLIEVYPVIPNLPELNSLIESTINDVIDELTINKEILDFFFRFFFFDRLFGIPLFACISRKNKCNG
jgi:hypothetical protein